MAAVTAVPQELWSIVGTALGAVIALLGVVLTSWLAGRRQRQQLAHDASQRDLQRDHDVRESALDRKMQLRRDVYLPAIEATLSALSSMGSLCDPLVERKDVAKRWAEYMAAIGKANAIARVETAGAVGELGNNLSAMFFELSMLRGPIEQAYQKFLANAGVVERVLSEQRRWTELQTNAVVHGAVERDQWDRLVGQLDFVKRQFVEWSALRDEAAGELAEHQLVFLKRLAELQRAISVKGVNASLALREELSLKDDDPDALRAVYEDHARVASETITSAIEELSQKLAVARASAKVMLPNG
ncbi:hypothetical protein [Paraburkholderia sacchari]|uniref:hypothetical protein n=1 Tax=Paraburkholderia sacchari TaxID=159450 RepID=UPI001BCE438C|nr:hypothetical protein [Paraburkholderia sacchari]